MVWGRVVQNSKHAAGARWLISHRFNALQSRQRWSISNCGVLGWRAILGVLRDALPCHYPSSLLCKQGISKLDSWLNKERWAVTLESSHAFSVSTISQNTGEDERLLKSSAVESTWGVSNMRNRRHPINSWWNLLLNIKYCPCLNINTTTLIELTVTKRVINTSKHRHRRRCQCLFWWWLK